MIDGMFPLCSNQSALIYQFAAGNMHCVSILLQSSHFSFLFQLLLVTEYLEGGSLDSVMLSLSERQKWRILECICEAMIYLHNKDIIHRKLMCDHHRHDDVIVCVCIILNGNP